MLPGDMWNLSQEGFTINKAVSWAHRWFLPVILTSWEAEIGRIAVWIISLRNPISKITRAKWTGGVAQQ
jgi:hypothetical protein